MPGLSSHVEICLGHVQLVIDFLGIGETFLVLKNSRMCDNSRFDTPVVQIDAGFNIRIWT